MTTGAQRDLQRFLGKRNFKGLYTKNPLARTPDYHKFDKKKALLTSYPVRPQHYIGKGSVEWDNVFTERNVVPSRQPFPENSYTKSNRLIGAKLRQALVAGHEAGESIQQLSFRFGLGVPRVEAVVKLDQVRKQSQKQLAGPQKYLRKDIQKMAKCMTALFDEIPTNDEGVPYRAVDNLTEIPMMKETRQQLFQSIAESEPFGPVDAAEVLGIEPAASTLEKLTNVESEVEHKDHQSTKARRSFYAQQLEGERHLFRFTDDKVGSVGYHYGASRDDQKSARRVRHLPDGTKVYPLPEHS